MKRSVWFAYLLVSLSAFGQQIPMGEWKLHATFRDTRICEATDEFVYAASGKGFFRVKNNTGEMTVLTKTDGFSSNGVSALDYSGSNKTLIIGYSDGYIDLLKEDRSIVSIPGFYNKLLQGDKSILHIQTINNTAFLSTYFGILVVDIAKAEIKDSYTSIGLNGSTQSVLSTAIMGDSIFAGVPDGILSARYNESINLNDYRNWKKVSNRVNCQYLCAFNDTLYFESDSGVYFYKNGKSNTWNNLTDEFIAGIKVYNSNLEIFRKGGIYSKNSAGAVTTTGVNIISGGTKDKNGDYWFCTGFQGGVIKIVPGDFISFEPNGPSSNSLFAMTKSGDFLFTSGGGISSTFGNAFNPAGFYIYNNLRWNSNPSSAFNTNLYDYTFVHHNTVTGRYYVGTQTNGMLEFSGSNATNKFDDLNSTLTRDVGFGFIRISGIANDKSGNLWVTNYGASEPLHVMSRSGVWTSIQLNENGLREIVVDDNNFKWMILQSGGILVYDDNNTPSNPLDDRSTKITTAQGLITNEVLSLSTDKNGYVWIGTSQGLNVVSNPFSIFTNPKVDRFVIEQNGAAGYLLGEETINDIVVDGGNRKWFATSNGVFLVDPNGQKVLVQYTAENSPLPDNRIYCAGQTANGEVFFGTEDGIVSYRSDASEAEETFDKIKIYPNPVRPEFSGVVTIEGLAENAEIRITDAAGMLIYQTTANGGTAIWPCKRLDGSKPASGVYYVFGINKEGTETAMGKFIYLKN